MKKVIFLDRDGVINKERKDYVKNLEEFEILDGIAEAITNFRKAGFLIIVITNQSAINRGLLSVETLDLIHSHLQKFLKKTNTRIDAFYYCPHIPEENCLCRKPKPGLLLKAASDFKIDFSSSYMIGDKVTDIEAAKSVKCNYYLIDSKNTLLDISKKFRKPDNIN